ncbi:MerR family transcriptional regulator [Nocardia sp. NPDC004278]|uniref:MerR family transcriptional regulator n=1 Tax=unclassified Nocardia TaxID=2637762 RepID=UPI0033B2FA9F
MIDGTQQGLLSNPLLRCGFLEDMAVDAEFTISALAHETGMTVRTLRDYNERGLLPPPQMKGRIGFYSEEHLNRIRIIGRLLERGITLNGVRGLLEAWDRGDDLADVLGVSASTAAQPQQPSRAPAGERVAATDLAEYYREIPGGLARVVAAGLYEPLDADSYRITDPELVDVLDQLIDAGIPPARALDDIDRLRADCDHIARQFADMYERTIVRSFRRSARTAQDARELAEHLTAARKQPRRVVSGLVDRFVARHLDYLTERELADLQHDQPT